MTTAPTPTTEPSGAAILAELEADPSAQARDLRYSETKLKALRDLFGNTSSGPYLFAQSIFGYRDLIPEIHLGISNLIGRWGQSVLRDGSVIYDPPVEDTHDVVDSYRRLMVCIPREHFKTSLCARTLPLWILTKFHDATIGIFNEKEENSKSWVAAIADIVESSQLFQVLWPEMLPRGVSYWDREAGVSLPRQHKWGGSGLLFERGVRGIPELSIEPHGIGSAAAGKHFTHKVLDDIIGLKSADSVAVMQEAVNWIDVARALERPAENGCEIVCYTTWAHNDVYKYMVDKWPSDYKIYKRSFLENPETGEPDPVNGVSIFPAKIGTRKAKNMLATDPYSTWAQYMCIPKSGRHLDFNESWLRYGSIIQAGEEPVFRIEDEFYDPTILDIDSGDDFAPQFIPLMYMDIAIILDPAPTKSTEQRQEPRARNGLAVVAKDPWGRRFGLDYAALQDTPIGVLREIIRLHEKWNPLVVAIEEVNFSALYACFYEPILRQDYPFVEINFMACRPAGRRKEVRITQLLAPIMENGFWYLNRATARPFVMECLEYPNGDTCDLMDAAAYTDEVVHRPDTPDQMYYVDRKRAGAEQGAGVTGYGDFV